MRLSYRWLKDYVDFELTPAELADKLTMAGFEVEDVAAIGGSYTDVVTALIETVDRHPDADKLTVCSVFDGSERFTVVCGAPNVAAGRIGVLARVGAHLPEGKLKKAKVRGVESFGMLCSRRELGLGDDHSGIWLLPEGTPLGREPQEALGLDDWLIEVNVTPNRPDCLSVIGLAREVAALVGAPLRRPAAEALPTGGEVAAHMAIDIQDAAKCPRYCGFLVRGVKLAPSPLWMVHRLEAAGVRAINNVVDITNFVLLEYGQPLHAFDYDFVRGRKIVVRRATEGETIVTLDEIERKLGADDLLICDGERPVALAGIMGGLNSEITETTKDVFVESAYFEPTGIRRTSKRLGLSSESSQRFERGTDIAGAMAGGLRAARLMEELAGGTIVPGYLDAYPAPRAPREVKARPARINHLLGTELTAEAMAGLLASIELDVIEATPEAIGVRVPTFRVDLEREVDLAEEVARLFGFENVPPTINAGLDGENRPWALRPILRRVRHELAAAGLTELATLAFIDPPALAATGAPDGLRLANPLSEDLAVLRSSLLPSLLKVLAYNQARNTENVQVFEARRVYLQKGRGVQPDEPQRLGLLMAGRRYDVAWNQPADAVDFFDLKGVVERLFAALGISEARVSWQRPADAGPYLPGASAELSLDGRAFGLLGKVRPEVLEHFEAKGEVFAGEIDIDSLVGVVGDAVKYRGVSKFPPMLRDLAVLVDTDVAIDARVAAIRETEPERIMDVRVFDIYTGKGVPEGKKSVAFSMRYQDMAKSLSDKDADKITRRVLEALDRCGGAILRQ